jgi:hypothetical protein
MLPTPSVRSVRADTSPAHRARSSRWAAAAGVVLTLLATARHASAMGLCDEEGHFCITLDVASARVCDTSKPGSLDPATCEPGDELLRTMARTIDRSSGGATRSIGSFVVRFEDLRVNVAVTRFDALPELTDDASLAAFAGGFEQGANGTLRSSGWLVESAGPPSRLLVHDVPVARTQWHGVSANVTGAVHFVQIVYAVQAAGAGYLVTFVTAGSDVSRLAPFAEASIATLDAVPRGAARGEDPFKWIARGLIASAVLAVVVVVVTRRSRRGRNSIEPRDLWPMH